MVASSKIIIGPRAGDEVSELIVDEINKIISRDTVAIGISVPGIVWHEEGKVWAPNISGWDNYPLMKVVEKSFTGIRIILESDRACYILGESWMGTAKRTRNAIFLAVGTGIGAGIMANGTVIQGSKDIGGAVGWMILPAPPFSQRNVAAFEHYASGKGIARLANELIQADINYRGQLREFKNLRAEEVLAAYDEDEAAKKTIDACIEIWGMGIANLVSIFNPEKVILGGGVFGPAARFIPQIKDAAAKYCQPVSNDLYHLVPAATGEHAGLYGAGYAAILSENY